MFSVSPSVISILTSHSLHPEAFTAKGLEAVWLY
jgi:hypothetical protein